MNLYLIQHGDAVEKEVDPDRPLSPAGLRDAEAVAAFAGKAGVRVRSVWHSGKTRALQTAEQLARAIAPKGRIEKAGGLNPKDPVAGLAKQLAEESEDLAIVGHLPHLSCLASYLLAGDEDAETIAFQRGGMVCLSRDAGGRWHVSWMVVPPLLTR